MENKKLYIVTYAHSYDFEVYTESRVYDTEEKACDRFTEYLKDVYEQVRPEDTFEDWVYNNTNGFELLLDANNDGCDFYNVHIETTELNKD